MGIEYRGGEVPEPTLFDGVMQYGESGVLSPEQANSLTAMPFEQRSILAEQARLAQEISDAEGVAARLGWMARQLSRQEIPREVFGYIVTKQPVRGNKDGLSPSAITSMDNTGAFRSGGRHSTGRSTGY